LKIHFIILKEVPSFFIYIPKKNKLLMLSQKLVLFLNEYILPIQIKKVDGGDCKKLVTRYQGTYITAWFGMFDIV